MMLPACESRIFRRWVLVSAFLFSFLFLLFLFVHVVPWLVLWRFGIEGSGHHWYCLRPTAGKTLQSRRSWFSKLIFWTENILNILCFSLLFLSAYFYSCISLMLIFLYHIVIWFFMFLWGSRITGVLSHA